MNISIFGLGYVGCVNAGCLAEMGHSVIAVDIIKSKVDRINAGIATVAEPKLDEIIREQRIAGRIQAISDVKEAVSQTDISFICVGTEMLKTGRLNIKRVLKVVDEIGRAIKDKKSFHVVVIRSTIMPGTYETCCKIIETNSGKERDNEFAVVCNPEFLRESTGVSDYFHPPYTLIGSNSIKATKLLRNVYKRIKAKVIVTIPRTAEIIKLVNNSFHALKVCFANEVGNICQGLGVDSHEVMEIFCQDNILNISSCYLNPGFAYGGSCLPKDLRALMSLGADLHLKTPIISGIEYSNALQLERAMQFIEVHNPERIGILGLSFKQGTNDLRNSPSILLIKRLLAKDYKIKVYDKNIELSELGGINREYLFHQLPNIKLIMSKNITELLDESDVIVVTTKDPSYSEYLASVFDKHIVDLVRVGDNLLGRLNYSGICW